MVLSLLRLGDWLQARELLRDYVAANGVTETHVVLQHASRTAVALDPQWKTTLFPRDTLARELVEENGSWPRAHALAEEWLREILTWKPTHVIDLAPTETSQGISAWLAMNGVERVEPTARYRDFLNDRWIGNARPPISWTDVLAGLIGRPSPELPAEEKRESKTVVLQVLTSDGKKNWPLDRWRALAHGLRAKGYAPVAVAAPNERELVEKTFDGAGVETRVTDLAETAELLQNAALLISGDTAILHLAGEARVPTLALFLGSANPAKTAPRLHDAWIIASKTPCFPCDHRAACSQPRHRCAEDLSVDQVLRPALAKLQSSAAGQDVSMVRTGFENRIYVKDILQGGSVNKDGLSASKRRALDQVVWGFYLDERHEEMIPPYGSAVNELMLMETFNHVDLGHLRDLAGDLEDAEEIVAILNADLLAFCRSCGSGADRAEVLWQKLRVRATAANQAALVSDGAKKLIESLNTGAQAVDSANYFERARSAKAGLAEMALLLQIEKKTISVLIGKIEERSRRVTRAREVSSSSVRSLGSVTT